MTTQIKYFGTIEAIIDSDRKQVTLRKAPRRREPLSKSAQERIMEWALSRVEPLRKQGYQLVDKTGDMAPTSQTTPKQVGA